MARQPSVSRMISDVAAELGLEVHREPEWGYAGYMNLPSGRSYFRNQHVGLNELGAAEVAKDKDQTAYFLRDAGFPTIEGRTFFTPQWAQENHAGTDRDVLHAYPYAKSLGLPVIVKPNSLSQGNAVAAAYSRSEFMTAARRAAKADGRVVLVQRFVAGQDYRLVVLDGEVISAYERLPLQIIGDGESNIAQLLEHLNEQLLQANRGTHITVDDYRVRARLRRLRMTAASIPTDGELVRLLDNANLSSGGTSIDFTSSAHTSYRDLAIAATATMGLRLAGVDIIARGSLTQPLPSEHWIVEMNASPGLDHYASMGDAQTKVVNGLYRQVVLALLAGSRPTRQGKTL